MLPCGGLEFTGRVADKRLRQAVGAVDKIESEAALGAQEVAVDTALVAIVGANNLRAIVGRAHAESDFATVGAVRADGRNVAHLPGPRFVAVAAAGERAHGANIDAHAALLAVELMAAVGHDHGVGAAVVHAQGPNVHAFAAHANAAVTEDAARAVVKDGGRPLLLVAMILGFDVVAFARAVAEGHILQLALAARVANGAVERVIAEKQFDGGLARLRNLGRFSNEYLALRDGRGAGGLQLGYFILAHDAHAAGGLQREARIVAEGRNFDARFAASVNEKRSRRSGEFLAVDCEGDVGHLSYAARTASPVCLQMGRFTSIC